MIRMGYQVMISALSLSRARGVSMFYPGKLSLRHAALAATLLAAFEAHAATLQVPAQYATIQAAINAAKAGDKVRVSAGTYHERLQISKEIEVVSVSGPEHTILTGDGDRYSPVVFISLQDKQSMRFKGFTVTGGRSYENGGGLLVTGKTVIENNVITGNYAYTGGGLVVWGPGATIRHNRFVGNEADVYGGGIHAQAGDDVLITDNVFESNTAGRGGGVALYSGSPVVLRNIITQNLAGDGAGISSRALSPYVADNLVYANGGSDTYSGGGVYISGPDSALKSEGMWVNNTVADNAAVYGSQLAISFFNHRALIANNAISASDGSVAVHCEDRDGSLPRFETNDVYSTGTAAANGSCAAVAVGGTNLSVPPAFVTGADGHPYHLAPDSPLVDAGTNKVVRRIPRDLSGGPRIVDGGHGPFVDTGAYEYRP
jgi:Right handed beta helix region